MKWTMEIKSKFTVFVLCSEVEKGAGFKTAISQEGFETFLFTDQEVLYKRMEQAAPHVLVLIHGALSVPLEEFVQAVVDMNSEIRFLPVFPNSEVGTLLKYRPFNFSNAVLEGDGLLSRTAWAVDEICQSLYLTYQNEQVYSLFEKAKNEAEVTRTELATLERRAEHAMGVPIQQEYQKYLAAKSKEEVLTLFLRELNQKFLGKNKKISAIYFKYLPSVLSFVSLQALGIEIESLKGVGCRLTKEEARDPVAFFSQGGIPSEMKTLMREGLNAVNGLIKPVFVQSQLDGFFILWSVQSEVFLEEMENDLSLFALMYERSHFEKKLAQLDMADETTELHGRQYYLRQLSDEVARARRLQRAVAVIKISVDQMSELQQSVGRGGRDQILRSIAGMLKKTSRVNDINCRTGENEFSLILPHAASKGASVRAERVRRMVEAYSLKWTGNRFTVSCGIAEYPSHCSSAEDLEKAAAQMLEFVRTKGGNKVCLFEPAESFRPDYDVPPL